MKRGKRVLGVLVGLMLGSLAPHGALPIPGLSSAASAQTSVDLRPKFRKGQEIRLDMTVESSSATTFKAEGLSDLGNQNSSMDQKIGLLLRCTGVDEGGNASVDLVYESLRVKLVAGEFSGSFDSTKPAPRKSEAGDEALAELAKSIVGTTLKLTIDRDGNITQVQGGEQLASLGPLAEMARQMQSPAGAKQMFGPIVSVQKQPGAVKPGESWTTTSILDTAMGRFKIVTDHRLDSVRAQSATIPFVGRIEPDSEAPGATPVKIKSASIRGTAIWDTETGMIRTLDSRQSVSMDLNMAGVAGTLKSETNVKVTRRPPGANNPPAPREPAREPAKSPKGK